MLLTALTSLALSAVRTGNAYLKNQQRSAVSAIRGAEAVLSFYTATVVEVLETAHTVSEPQLRVLYPFLIGGLGGEVSNDEKAQDKDTTATMNASQFGPCTTAWKRASCMLVSELVRVVQLGAPLVSSLINTIAASVATARSLDYGGNSDIEDLLLAFTMVAQYQEVGGDVDLCRMDDSLIPPALSLSSCMILLTSNLTFAVLIVAFLLFSSLLFSSLLFAKGCLRANCPEEIIPGRSRPVHLCGHFKRLGRSG